MVTVLLLLFSISMANGLTEGLFAKCHLSLLSSGVDINSFYPLATEPQSLPLLRVSDKPNDLGSCVVILSGCDCGCKNTETAILAEVHGWNKSCIVWDSSVMAAEQRTVNTDQGGDGSIAVMTINKNAITGAAPTESLADVLAAQNMAPVFRPQVPRAVMVDSQAEIMELITTTVTTAAPTTASPFQKQRDAYDELRILAVVQSYLDSVTNDAPEARHLDSELDALASDSLGVNITDTTTTDASTISDFPTTVDSTTTVKADIQSDHLNDNTTPISKQEYNGLFDQVSSWRSKYFVVLGFFLCFTIIFVIVIAILCVKLKNAQAGVNPGNLSPGPGCDTEPLTPNPQGQSGNFNFDDKSLPR